MVGAITIKYFINIEAEPPVKIPEIAPYLLSLNLFL